MAFEDKCDCHATKSILYLSGTTANNLSLCLQHININNHKNAEYHVNSSTKHNYGKARADSSIETRTKLHLNRYSSVAHSPLSFQAEINLRDIAEISLHHKNAMCGAKFHGSLTHFRHNNEASFEIIYYDEYSAFVRVICDTSACCRDLSFALRMVIIYKEHNLTMSQHC